MKVSTLPANNHPATILKLLCRGLDRTRILAYAADQHWTETPKQIDSYIAEANTQLAEEAAAIDTETELGKAIARLNHLYMEAVKVQDHKTALAIQKELNKVLVLKVKARAPAAQPAGKPRLKIVTR